jgi:hypothetical protein
MFAMCTLLAFYVYIAANANRKTQPGVYVTDDIYRNSEEATTC